MKRSPMTPLSEGKRKKNTDKERLDYLLHRVIPYADGALMFDPLAWMGVEAGVIQDRCAAIDAAIKAERRPESGRGK